MQADVDHILLTRFNLPSKGAESFVRSRDGWLRSRMELFERYCLPSVASQTVKSFNWVIYFDPQSPEWLKTKVRQLAETSVFTPIYRAEVSRQELLQDLREVSGAKHANLMTTNLDNDDGLALDFVQRLQEIPAGPLPTAVFLVHGLIRSDQRIYLRTDRSNAFCSVREDWSSAQTCWATWHNLLRTSMDVIEVGGGPAWLQVIHGANVSNRIRGRRISAAPYRPTFGSLLDGAENLKHGALLKDVMVDRPVRRARDIGRAVVKEAAMAMMGRDGLDRLKAGIASHYSTWTQIPHSAAIGAHRSRPERTAGKG